MPSEMTAEPLVTVEKLVEVTDSSVHTIWRAVNSGRIPRPIYVAPRAPRWKLSEVLAALEATRATPAEARAARRRNRAAQVGAGG